MIECRSFSSPLYPGRYSFDVSLAAEDGAFSIRSRARRFRGASGWLPRLRIPISRNEQVLVRSAWRVALVTEPAGHDLDVRRPQVAEPAAEGGRYGG
jgi:hypothetical protein